MKKLITLITLLLLLCSTLSFAQNPSKGSRVEATGTGAIAKSFTAVRNTYLKSVSLHLSAAATQETLTITLDSAKGAAYDTVLFSQAMAGYADVVWLLDDELLLEEGDIVIATFTNTDARTYGIVIAYEN